MNRNPYAARQAQPVNPQVFLLAELEASSEYSCRAVSSPVEPTAGSGGSVAMSRSVTEGEDYILVRRVILGSNDAFKTLVQKYQRLSATVIARLVPDPEDVRDLNQECYLQVYRHLHTFRFDSSLATWIAHVAHSTAYRHLRKHRAIPMPDSTLQTLLDEQVLPQDLAGPLIQNQVVQVLRAAIARLGAVEREMLQKHYFEEMPIADIARVTGLAVGTIKSHLSRARARLRLSLNEMT